MSRESITSTRFSINASLSRVALAVALLPGVAGCEQIAADRPGAVSARKAQAPQQRQRVDAARERVWVVNQEGVFLEDRRTGKKTTFELPGWQWIDRPYACMPDLALGPRGEVVITSNIVSTLWRIDPETLAVSVHPVTRDADTEKDVGYSGIVYSAQARAYFGVSDVHGSLWRIDPSFVSGQKVKVSIPLANACSLELQEPVVPISGTDVALCVRSPEGGRRIIVAADQRSASVQEGACVKGG